MFRSTARRIAAAAVVAVAALAVAIALATGPASARDPHATLYRNFCPLEQSEVQAAGPYSSATHNDAKSIRPLR